MRALLRPLAIACLTASLAACGTLDRPTGPLRLTDPDGPNAVAMSAAASSGRVSNFTAQFGELLAKKQKTEVLALSGGGANGAYGAGLVYGWSEAGNRPVFDIVTGVSTGALAAPFAFLGREWDEELKQAYTSQQTENLIGLRSFSAFFNPSLFSSTRLYALVESYATPELLAAIAVEHAKGRRLLVATTNLDTQLTVIWDMGAIASRGDEASRTLFKQVLVASASIPGVFPPVLLPGQTEEGQAIAEMHVDGGVNIPYLAVPEELFLWTSPNIGNGREGALYVIVNGQTGRNSGTTAGRLTGILGRTYDSMSKASLRTHLAVTSAFAERNGMELSFSAIPDNVQASALAFDQASMTALFELARQRVRDGAAWIQLDPTDSTTDLVPENRVSEADIPIELAIKPEEPKVDKPEASNTLPADLNEPKE